ncbi:transposase IS200 family protein [Jejuia pallidilutea]|uniref:site-specific DNA-methyltransferase (adenine-specific) n=1 Tax=Jejuia pallidilutea TaxID=504487 RepID=A0A362X0Y9_9FLAO|nr:DNA methyltransferase [Jejuia pallidilutea]PQV49541.1 transposase IS200 family protein [Jejuia pallidilutea]
MSLYQNSVLNKYLKGLDTEKVNKVYQKFTEHFHNSTIQENIRNSKEEQYQGEFLIDLFVNVLGYTKNPTPNFNLTTELKNIRGSRKTDGAILSREHAPMANAPLAKVLAVIELKGTNTTDLSRVETQAFGYKNNQPGCNYVITSNFEKLRFYIDNAVEFEEFNLFQLSKERFNILYLCLSAEYLLNDIPKKIKNESLTQEENVTKKLYKDYASFRNEIFDAIQKENPEYDKLTLFKKTQKLLDRFLFIFFAEDRLLLPPNSIRAIINQWTDLKDKYDEYFPLYNRFQKYFGYMNTGHKGQKHDIFAYNGGLFAPDDILDNIKINDDLLYKHTLNLSNYDFESEVSVNILGHIFEHSLNDIDEIQAEIASREHAPLVEIKTSKRKKDGVFYTPKYITKYIVDNTVGKLCEEKKTELDIQEAEYEKERRGRQKATLKKLSQKLEDYRKWLLQITICDPACGSGAFLNQALEFLIAEHQYIDELQAKLFGDAMVLSEVENAILENNLFGVDINEESVEIAKLSLWLRTAQKGRKLTSLNNNIKCGNSLIDDPTVAGDKAFNWQNEFPEVFKEKNKKIYHITTAIHDSRTSARMKKYKVRERRDAGTNPYPNVIYFTPEDDLLITQTIADIVKEDALNLLAYNICADHIHLLIACDIEEIPSIMQKIKAITAKEVNKTREHVPITREHAPLANAPLANAPLENKKRKPLWSQKYSTPKEVTTQEQLDNTLRYIQNNRQKHELPPHSNTLQTIIDSMCVPVDKALEPEYTGGFDVVIGNPPYVGTKQIDEIDRNFYWNRFNDLLFSEMDLYQIFLYKSINEFLISSGKIGFITPNSYFTNVSFKNLRNYLINETSINEIIDFPYRFYPFNDVNTETSIIIITKVINEKNKTILKTVDKSLQLKYKGLLDVFRNQKHSKSI